MSKRKSTSPGEKGLFHREVQTFPNDFEGLKGLIECHNQVYDVEGILARYQAMGRRLMSESRSMAGELVTPADLAEQLVNRITAVRHCLANGDARTAVVEAMLAQRCADRIGAILNWEHSVVMHRRLRDPKGKGAKEEAAIEHNKWLAYGCQLLASGKSNKSAIARQVAQKFRVKSAGTVRSVFYRKKLWR